MEIDKVVTLARKNHGITVKPSISKDGKRYQFSERKPNTGFMVSMAGSEVVLPDYMFNEATISLYVRNWFPIDRQGNPLNTGFYELGIWFDEESDRFYLDRSVWVNDDTAEQYYEIHGVRKSVAEVALAYAEVWSQKAIWDCAAKREVRL